LQLAQFNNPNLNKRNETKNMTTLHLRTSTVRSPSRIGLLLIPLALACFAVSPAAQAVSPAPDGGYPNGNTAEGQNALFTLTTGEFNTAVGFFALDSNTTGSFNTALGAGTLFATTVGSNTAVGAGALLSNTIGFGNTATGAFALVNNTTGLTNVANGYQALSSNTTGGANTAIGTGALFSNTIGAENTATGLGALAANTTGVDNTANGLNALMANITGSGNTAIGSGALGFNTSGHGNTALGDGAGSSVTTASNVISIGSSGADVANSCFIGNIRGITTANNDAIPVLIDSAGQLGTVSSSRRYKTDIKPMDKASESILALKPVSFRYKVHKDATPQFGLIAEQVAEVNPDLVVRDKNGEIYTVRYDQVNAMLLNEFLKEHSRVEELKSTVATKLTTMTDLKSTVAQQQQEIQALAATVKEQAAQIQKVSAQLEASKPAPQVVKNP